MALKLKVERASNKVRGEFPAGYHRILQLNLDKLNDLATIRIGVYADEAARRFSSQPGSSLPGQTVPVASEMIAEEYHQAKLSEMQAETLAGAYAWLKTTDKFKAAEDC